MQHGCFARSGRHTTVLQTLNAPQGRITRPAENKNACAGLRLAGGEVFITFAMPYSAASGLSAA